MPTHQSSRPEASVNVPASTIDSVDAGTISLSPGNYWTGAKLTGSYKKNATSAVTYGYVENLSELRCPHVDPWRLWDWHDLMSIWNGLDNVFQAIVDVETTPTMGYFGIHRQNFYNGLPRAPIDEEGADFIPKSGETVIFEEWYCDAAGHVNMAGGYGCTFMFDMSQNLQWECDQGNSSTCQSYTIAPLFLTNGTLGQTAEFIIEDDTDETKPNCP